MSGQPAESTGDRMMTEDQRIRMEYLERAVQSYNEVIDYVLNNPYSDPIAFLECWAEGDFSALRNEWEDVPEEVFWADPLHETNREWLEHGFSEVT